jgi:RNA polymerase sigma factor (sigma-70 family)
VLSSSERPNADSAATGGGEAFLADLDRRYRVPLIRYFAKRIRETYDVDDLIQEVFIRLVRQAAIESVQQIDSYVFQTAANVIRDRARRQAARHHREHHELTEGDPQQFQVGERANATRLEWDRSLGYSCCRSRPSPLSFPQPKVLAHARPLPACPRAGAAPSAGLTISCLEHRCLDTFQLNDRQQTPS